MRASHHHHTSERRASHARFQSSRGLPRPVPHELVHSLRVFSRDWSELPCSCTFCRTSRTEILACALQSRSAAFLLFSQLRAWVCLKLACQSWLHLWSGQRHGRIQCMRASLVASRSMAYSASVASHDYSRSMSLELAGVMQDPQHQEQRREQGWQAQLGQEKRTPSR